MNDTISILTSLGKKDVKLNEIVEVARLNQGSMITYNKGGRMRLVVCKDDYSKLATEIEKRAPGQVTLTG